MDAAVQGPVATLDELEDKDTVACLVIVGRTESVEVLDKHGADGGEEVVEFAGSEGVAVKSTFVVAAAEQSFDLGGGESMPVARIVVATYGWRRDSR